MKTKIIRKSAVLICWLGMMSALTSCTFINSIKMIAEAGKASINGKQVTIRSMGDPKTECLVYGYIDSFVSSHMYVQMDSSKEAVYITPLLLANGPFCFPPLAKDLSFQLAQIRQSGAFATYIYSPGLGKESNIAFTVEKAGLQFIGAYKFVVNGNSARFSPYPRSEQLRYELQTLTKMKVQFRNTDWEAIIDKRIEEIHHEKK